MIVWLFTLTAFTLTAIATTLGVMQRASSQQRLRRLPVRVKHNRYR